MSVSKLRTLRISALLAASFLLTGAVGVSCSGDPSLDPARPANPGNPTGSSRPASSAIGQWSPNPSYDTCTQSFHDTYFAIGPDGKRYPTWHPPSATDPASGRECSFGHEHGRDPRGSGLWNFARAHFAFDENRNGLIDPSERDASGLPFGYVTEQLITFDAANGIPNSDRIEDHVGHKIAWENGVRRERLVNGVQQSFDLFCDVLTVVHQETHTAESLASNLHQLTYAIDCNRGIEVSRSSVKLLANVMATSGNPSSFVARVPTGFLEIAYGVAQPVTSPPGGIELGRLIPTIDNVRTDIFVPGAQTSNFSTGLVEKWSTAVSLIKFDGVELAAFDPAFTVYSPSRYYDPDQFDGIGRSIDLCYTGLDAAGQFVNDPLRAGSIVRQARGVECVGIAPNGPATSRTSRIELDDPRSPFNGCRREIIFGASTVRNGGGATTIWYSDPYGGAARTVSFAGALKQYVSAVDNTTQGITLASSTFGGDLSYCAPGAGIHAPN